MRDWGSNPPHATKISVLSIISANPATIRICMPRWRFEKLRLKILPRSHDAHGLIEWFRFACNRSRVDAKRGAHFLQNRLPVPNPVNFLLTDENLSQSTEDGLLDR